MSKESATEFGPDVVVALGRSVKGMSAERGMRTEIFDRSRRREARNLGESATARAWSDRHASARWPEFSPPGTARHGTKAPRCARFSRAPCRRSRAPRRRRRCGHIRRGRRPTTTRAEIGAVICSARRSHGAAVSVSAILGGSNGLCQFQARHSEQLTGQTRLREALG